VPFSCKGRGLCPSCGQRRCQEFSDFLHQEVLAPPSCGSDVSCGC
jgi:hypothetical protein